MAKEHDIVVFGATGYTGRLVVEQLARATGLLRSLGPGKARRDPVRFAIAGRDERKLRGVASELGIDAHIIVASPDDRPSLRRMCEAASVVLSCAGPFATMGEPVVAACVDAKSDYLDITGEPDFVRDVIERHDERARGAGLRVVPCCGFDSVPADLGVWFTMDALGVHEHAEVETFVHTNWDISGGTWQTILGGLSRGRGTNAIRLPRDPGRGRRVQKSVGRPRFEPDASGWVVPSPMIDPEIVLRSAAALTSYGPDFTYGCYFRVGSLAKTAALGAAAGALFGLTRLSSTRELLARVKPSHSGASARARERGFFRVTTVAHGGGEKLVTRVSGGDKYEATAVTATQAALALVEDRDRLPSRAGVLTPAVAFERRLVERLDREGIRFEIVRRTTEGAR